MTGALTLGEYALLKNLGDASGAAADLFAHGLIMLAYASRNAPRDKAIQAWEATVTTGREAFLEMIGAE